MAKNKQRLTAGELVFRWIDGTSSKRHHYLTGVIRHRGRYEAWANYLLAGLSNAEFLTQLEAQDPWAKSKLVGQKISELKTSYRQLSEEQRTELAKASETELKTGLALLAEDKKAILALAATAADP